jgi:hypothetical protein
MMQYRWDISGRLFVSGLLLALSGCSSSIDNIPAAAVPVEGTLTYRRQPLAEAQLMFYSDDLPEPAFAVTDAGGRFRCMTNDSSAGIPAGAYVVTVTSLREGIPEKYSAAESSPLSITVQDGGENRFALELED